MKARQLFRYMDRREDVAIERVIRRLPLLTRGKPHGLKYRLYCGRGGRCATTDDMVSIASVGYGVDDTPKPS